MHQLSSLKKITRKAILSLCILLIIAGFNQKVSAQTPSYQWKNVQILAGGLVSGIVFNPAQKDLVYARTDVGGAYRWNVSDSTWTPLTDWINNNNSNYTGILSIAADPNNANKVYIATGLYSPSWAGTAAVFASNDQGNTWTPSYLTIRLGGNENGRTSGERLQVDPNLSSTLYLGSSINGLWKSTNSGSTWSQVTSFTQSGANSISFVLLDPTSATSGNPTQTIYVGIQQTGINLYKSTDGGTTWNAVANQPNNTLMPHHAILSGGNLFITYSDGPGPNGVTIGEVYKVATSTNTWTNISPAGTNQAGQGGYAGIAIDPTNANTFVITTLDRWYPNDEVFRTTNGGTSWTALLGTSPPLIAPVPATWDHSLAPYTTSFTNPSWLGSIAIDPFNKNKAIFITGYGIWTTYNLTAADAAQPTHWVFQDKGLEETVPLQLISPPSGSPLLSAIGDIDGFNHVSLTVSPAAGRLSPSYGTNTSIDFAEKLPTYMVRAYNNSAGNYGSYSTNGGSAWTMFSSYPSGTTGGGSISVSANGSTIVWSPGGTGMYYSTNNGTTWTTSTGVNTGLTPVADRFNPSKFYVYDGANGNVLISTNAGASFSNAFTGLPAIPSYELYAGSIKTVFGKEGDIWLNNPSGFYHSTNSGSTFTSVSGVQSSLRVGFGKVSPASTYPTVFIAGTVGGVWGFYRSTDEGVTWILINDSQHEFGSINDMVGDQNTYARVYIATGGRGIIYGDDNNALPLHLISFTGTKVNNGSIILNWLVSDEKNVNKYTVYKSTDLSSGKWQSIGVVSATNFSGIQQYNLTDNQVPDAASVYYKLVSENMDGSISTSTIISFNQNGASFEAFAYPNPSGSAFNILLTGNNGSSNCQIRNVLGQLVEENNNINGPQITVGSALASGIYFMNIQNGDNTAVVKLVKE